jgi:hypothetical protein
MDPVPQRRGPTWSEFLSTQPGPDAPGGTYAVVPSMVILLPPAKIMTDSEDFTKPGGLQFTPPG